MAKTFLLFFVLITMQGCTLFGLAGDLAILAAAGDPNEDKAVNDPTRVDTGGLTKLGLEQDVKVIKTVFNQIAEKNADKAAAANAPLFPANYANKALCKENDSLVTDCYSPEYYQALYKEAQRQPAAVNNDAAQPELVPQQYSHSTEP